MRAWIRYGALGSVLAACPSASHDDDDDPETGCKAASTDEACGACMEVECCPALLDCAEDPDCTCAWACIDAGGGLGDCSQSCDTIADAVADVLVCRNKQCYDPCV